MKKIRFLKRLSFQEKVITLLLKIGVKQNSIARLFGWSRSRISNSKRRIEFLRRSIPYVDRA